MLPALLAAGTALNVIGQLGSASSQRRAADIKAEALKSAAGRRLTKGKQESELLTAQGGAAQTSQLSSMLSRGISERASIVGQSLDEIANRAKFASDQALSDAQAEAQAMTEDASAISQQGRQAQKAALFGVAGSILGAGAGYLEGRFGSEAYKKFF